MTWPDGTSVSPEQEATAWAGWRERRDQAARALLLERYMPFAKAVAATLYGRRHANDCEFEDFRQFALVGLIESLERYEPGRGARFTTFAMPRIRGSILTGVERLTERQQQIAFQRRVAAERVASLAPAGEPLDHADRLLQELGAIGVGLALGLILEGTGMVQGPDASLPAGAYARLELRQLHARLWGLVGRLGERERLILERHYRDGRRFDEIAADLKLSKGRISQLHKQAITSLRGLLGGPETCDVTF